MEMLGPKCCGKLIQSAIHKNYFEKAAWRYNKVVCGLDEVGRGCLAGPVVTAAVIVPANGEYTFLKDSKIITERERERIYGWIVKNCWYAVSVIDNYSIDKHNIWHATLISMKKSLMHVLSTCPHVPASIVVDAMPLDIKDTSYYSIPVYYFDRGEQKSVSIAAASIVAKVYRDTIMKKMEKIFPGYDLAKHKGYGTSEHMQLLCERSPLIIHRKSFLKSVRTLDSSKNKDEYAKQCGIFTGAVSRESIC